MNVGDESKSERSEQKRREGKRRLLDAEERFQVETRRRSKPEGPEDGWRDGGGERGRAREREIT